MKFVDFHIVAIMENDTQTILSFGDLALNVVDSKYCACRKLLMGNSIEIKIDAS
jgi:hypothetical protein